MPDALFHRMFDDTECLSWAPVDEVRDRAHRRIRRTRMAMVTAVAVAAVAGGVAAARTNALPAPEPAVSPTNGHPTPPAPTPPALTVPVYPPPPTPSATAPPTDLDDELFLRPDDVGSGFKIATDPSTTGGWRLDYLMGPALLDCEIPDGSRHRLDRRERFLLRGSEVWGETVWQQVARYRPGDAARYMDRVRARVRGCDGGQTVRIVAQGFASQDSLLVETTFSGGIVARNVIVRQGDLVTEFHAGPVRSRAQSKELGVTAARRLCGGTPVC